jgi:hypothetical protein
MRLKQIPRLRAGFALVFAPVLLAGAIAAWVSSESPHEINAAPVELAVPAMGPDQLGQWCIDRKAAGTTGLTQRARDWLTDCVALFGTSVTPVPTTATSPALPPTVPPTTAAPQPTTAPPTTPPVTIPANATKCMAKPSVCGYPDATNTGVPAGTALTVVNGGMTISTAGAVVEGRDIRGCVRVTAPNVTIRKSKISCNDNYAILQQLTTGTLTVEDSEVNCQNSSGTAIGYNNFAARRLNISGCENGFDVDNNALIADSWIRVTAPDHSDGIQLNAGSHITIQHNTITNAIGTSAIISHPDGNSDVLIQNNLLAGGAYTLYCPEDRSTNFRVIGNRFSRSLFSTVGVFGPWEDCDKVAVNSGNVFDDDLRAVAL